MDPQPSPDPILFDWDGTLADSLGALYRANLRVMAVLGLPLDQDRYRTAYSPDWRAMYRNLGVPPARLEEANERWLAEYAGGLRVEPFPGVVAALATLRSDGHGLGLVTAGRRDIVAPQLERAGLERAFDVMVFGDDHATPKPDPAPLRQALQALAWADLPARATYVGDVPDDMRMAAAAGVRGVGIVSLVGTPEDLIAAGAAEVADSVSAWVGRRAAGGRDSGGGHTRDRGDDRVPGDAG